MSPCLAGRGKPILLLAFATSVWLAASGTVHGADSPAAGEEAPADGEPARSRDWLYSSHPYDWRQVGLDARYLVTRPAHLDRRGITKVALTFGTAGILYLYREEIRDWVQERRDPEKEEFLDKVSVMGEPSFAPSLALIAYGASFATRNPREKETAVLLLESMGFSGVLVGVGQSVMATQRPFDGEETEYFARRGHGVSGHAALAASVVPVLSRQYLTVADSDSGATRFWKVGAAGVLYAGAFLTAYQRLDSDEHWAPEAFLGLVTGFTVGQILSDSHEASRREPPRRIRFSAGAGSLQARIVF